MRNLRMTARINGEVWSEGAHAHLGITVPGFPNLFCVYGPGTNLACDPGPHEVGKDLIGLIGSGLAAGPGDRVERPVQARDLRARQPRQQAHQFLVDVHPDQF